MITTLQKFLSSTQMQSLITELGIENDTPENQAELLAILGSNATKRVVLALFEALPENLHPDFERFIGGGDMQGLHDFLEEHISDVDELVVKEIRAEFEATLAEAAKEPL